MPTVMPAMVTPFDRDGEIDLEAHRHNVGHLAAAGLSGFLIAGSTGEGPYLEPGERGTLVTAARDESAAAFLLCGISAETVRQALTQIEEAFEADADAVLVVTPTTVARGRDAEIEGFYLDVADSSPLPVCLYTVPGVTGYELPVDSIRRISTHAGIVAIKDSGGNPARIGELEGTVGEPFDMFIGASRAVATGLDAGAYGAITASANYAWPILTHLVPAKKANSPTVGAHQEALDALTATIEPMGLPATKAAAGMVGLREGLPRRPLRPLQRSRHAVVAAALRKAGLLEAST